MEKFNYINENELMAIDGGAIGVTVPVIPIYIGKYIAAFVAGFYSGLKS
jgi:hypothetical protein